MAQVEFRERNRTPEIAGMWVELVAEGGATHFSGGQPGHCRRTATACGIGKPLRAATKRRQSGARSVGVSVPTLSSGAGQVEGVL